MVTKESDVGFRNRTLPVWIWLPVLVLVLVLVLWPLDMRDSRDTARPARARADLRSFAMGLETYYVDHGTYPAHHLSSRLNADAPFLAEGLGSSGLNQPTLLVQSEAATLTTPVAYFRNYPNDQYAPVSGMTYRYFATEEWWIAWSPGPDREYELDYREIDQVREDEDALWDLLLQSSFDPTNGAVSRGDIWRMRDN